MIRNAVCTCDRAVFTPVLLAVGERLTSHTAEYRMICVNQTWSSVYAGVYVIALLFRRRYRRLATAARVWLSKPLLLLFALQFYTLGIAINHYVVVIDSLSTLVLISATLPAVGYIFAFCRKFVISRSCWFRKGDVSVVGPKMTLSGADLAASNCLLALAVFRLALDQPEADLASAVPIWLLILHPLPLLCYWMEANVRRCVKNHGTIGVGGNDGSDQRRQFSFARNLLRVSLTGGSLNTNSCDDIQLQTVERITVV